MPERVPNPGCRILVKGLKLLKGAVYLAKHHHNCGHGVTAANFTATTICRWLTYKNDDAGKDEPQEQPKLIKADLTEFRQPIQVQSHLEMPGILVQLGHIRCT